MEEAADIVRLNLIELSEEEYEQLERERKHMKGFSSKSYNFGLPSSL